MKNTPTKLTLATTAAVAVLAGAFAAPKAEAASSTTLIQLSHRLENGANELGTEFRKHFSHTSAIGHLISDANQIAVKARHIHGLAHNCTASLRHIEADVVSLDKLVHHLHEVVDGIESGRYGHTHGDTRHVHSLVSSINSTLHSMKRVAEALRRPTCGTDRYTGRSSCGTSRTYGYNRYSSTSSRYGRGYGSRNFRRW